ncbi:DUF4384 [Desulfonema limicola]|uniref:DUF4384 n=1 Tax=Desulfonema limicola TaxID=45656 RepID=A0A975B7H1_9BACT|nr:DUF4384 domain-containing protein [Desulfonema limicola]QTA80314.1 DUF4384 [Desulfonema limicola]
MKIFQNMPGIFIILICLFTVSCSMTPQLSRKEHEIFSNSPAPYEKSSDFTDALSNLGVMIETYGLPGNVIQGKNIINKTSCQNSLPLDITDMIKTAVNGIGEKIRYAVYDPQFDHYKHGDYFKVYGAGMFKQKPAVVIEGAITECDENLDTQGSGASGYGTVGGGTAESDLDGSINKRISYSRLAIDLHMMDFKNNWLLPQKQTSMAVDVQTLEKGRSFSFRIYGAGLGLDGERKVVHGKHDAVRSLVEISILKLIGRYLEIPYWRCIPGGKEDPEVIKMMRTDFKKQDKETRIKVIQHLLSIWGYNVTAKGILDQQTQTAVKDFRTRTRRGSTGIDENLYVDLMLSVPMPFLSEKKISGYGQSAAYSSPAPAVTSASESSSPLSFNASFVYRPGGNGSLKPLNEGAVLHSGDYYKIIITPLEDCWLYIFQADSSGKIFQLFPMQSFNGVVLNNSNPVRGNRKYTIPAENKSFFLDNTAGREKIWLVASRERNVEIESLYAELSRGQSTNANQRLYTRLEKFRGVQGVVSDKPVQVAWKETGEIFSIMTQRLDSICKNCAYSLEFNHK